MSNIGPDGCDARDTAPEEPPPYLDSFVAVAIDDIAEDVRIVFATGKGAKVSHYLSRPDAQFLARSIYDALEGFDHDAG